MSFINHDNEANGITESSGPTTLKIGAIADGELLIREGTEIAGGVFIGGDEQVKASVTDVSPGYLNEKIITNSSLTITILNAGTDEQFQISPVFGTASNTVAQGNDSRFPDSNQISALAGTVGAPSITNKYVTDSDPRLLGGEPSNFGIATVNFGITASTSATCVVTGQTSITSTSIIQTWVNLVATADHSTDEIFAENIQTLGGNIEPGVGFTIHAAPTFGKTYGDFQINWSWR